MNARAAREATAPAAPRVRLPRQLLRRAADALPHILWTMRADGAVEFANARAVAYTGLGAADFGAPGWSALIHPDDRERGTARLRKALRTGRGCRLELRIRRADGAYRWHLCSIEPVPGAGGRRALWCGIATDIEQRKRAEERLLKAQRALQSLVATRTRALEESVRLLREFLDRMPAVAWMKDARLRYVWVSESFVRAWRRRREEVLGRDNRAILPEHLARRARRDDERALRIGGPVQGLYTVPLADGSRVRMLSLRFPFPDERGELGVAGIAMELPEARRAADASEVEKLVDRLSARERQVLQLTVDGLTAAEIAARLALSPKSVETYRSRLMGKLGLAGVPSLVKFAIRHGLAGTR